MFGYIAPALGALSEEQRARYRAYYCGVCHALLRQFGSAGRLSLSNDMTFLALLLSSLYEPEETEQSARCAVHPAKAHTFRSSSAIDYAADMNLLLFWYKCRDGRMDDRSLRAAAGEKMFREAAARVADRWPRQAKGIEEALKELWELERSPSPSADALCALSGRMLGSAFVFRPEDLWAPELYGVGDGLGRFVYWMDAWEDFDADRKKGRFNPLVPWHENSDYESFCQETLEMLIAGATEHFEVLPLSNHLDLMRNILYAGVWQRWTLLNEKKHPSHSRKKPSGKEESHGQ